jgi:hypothetical protein
LDTKILGPLNRSPIPEIFHHSAVSLQSDLREARHAPDRLFALFGIPAEKQVGDALLRHNVTDMASQASRRSTKVGVPAD